MGHFEVLFVSTAADDPRNHTKRHKTRAVFVRFRVASWIVLFISTKEVGALIETDDYVREGSVAIRRGALPYGRASAPLVPWQHHLGTTGNSLAPNRQIFHEPPITARVNVDIADVLFRDDHVGLVPEGKHRQIAADDLLGPRIKRLRLCVIVGVRRLA